MPRGRPRQDQRTYNLNRRLGSLKRQQSHHTRVVGNTEARLSQAKQRLDSVNKQIADTERQLR
jgi:septal ring factor EnvC (AmiA/AmiB activator)